MVGTMSFGPLEIGIIVLIVLLLFGAKKLPELGSSLGSGIREFGQGIKGEKELEPGDEEEDTVKSDASSEKEPSIKG
jgi:sec-independent protein translocase protein TatA